MKSEKEFEEFCKKIIHNKNKFKLFKTFNGYYLYDTGTNKVISCEEEEYILINTIQKNYKDNSLIEIYKIYPRSKCIEIISEINRFFRDESILNASVLERFNLSKDFTSLDGVSNSLEQIILEVTEACNLRCKYCIYHPFTKEVRNFGNSYMSLEIGKRSIDYLIEHSLNLSEVAITFYGGEPLMNFNFIKEIVSYAKDIIINKKICFSLTTNLTLVTKEIAKFFAMQDYFSITCSLDGPKEIHDMWRVYKDGSPSFQKSIKGLEYLINAYGNRASTLLSFSMVYAPPYTIEKANSIEDFFKRNTWIPKDMRKQIATPTPGSVMDEDIEKVNKYAEKKEKCFQELENGHLKN